MRRKLAYSLLLSVLMLVVPASAFADKSVNGVPVLTTINELVDPKHAAVLVVDMQNEIVSTEGGYWRKDKKDSPSPQAHQVAPVYRELVGNIARFLQQARRRNIPILYAEYIHRDGNGKMVVNGPECWTHRNSAWVSCAVAGTWEARTIRELAPRRGDPVIQKSRANAFYNTYLDDILKDRSIKTLLLTGTAGGGCVFATAMGALERGYFATFVKDCVDQQSYLDSDLIKGRFPIHTSAEVFATWGDSADGKKDAAPEATKPPREDAAANPSQVDQRDIRRLSHHFLDPNGDTSPWMFIPKEHIKSLNTSEAPGLVTIREAGKGRDIKGILKDPIRISDYPLPWEFHLSVVQNSLAQKGLSENQINYAIGLNIALTFSDPSTWPKDRTKLPPDTHSAQVFVVHLGNQGKTSAPVCRG